MAGMAFSFSACGDDDDDEGTAVTQAQIEKYIYGEWFVDLGDAYFRFIMREEPFDESGNNGNYHFYRKSDEYVMMVSDFKFHIEGTNIVINTLDYGSGQEIEVIMQVLSINNKEAKIKGTLPGNDGVKTYTFKRTIDR